MKDEKAEESILKYSKQIRQRFIEDETSPDVVIETLGVLLITASAACDLSEYEFEELLDVLRKDYLGTQKRIKEAKVNRTNP